MLKYAIIFAIISLIAGAMGFTGIAAGSAGIAKILFVLFLVLAVVFVILAVMGVGATKRLSAVRWGVAKSIVWAWVLTFPMAAGVAALTYFVASPFLP